MRNHHNNSSIMMRFARSSNSTSLIVRHTRLIAIGILCIAYGIATNAIAHGNTADFHACDAANQPTVVSINYLNSDTTQPLSMLPINLRNQQRTQVLTLSLPAGHGGIDIPISTIGFVPTAIVKELPHELISFEPLRCGEFRPIVSEEINRISATTQESTHHQQTTRPATTLPSAQLHQFDADTIISKPHSIDAPNTHALYRWHITPTVLIVDTVDYATLSAFFKRLAFFIEKEGHKGTLYSEQELAHRYAWRGHNYNSEGLALFYNAMRSNQLALNDYEQQLLTYALTYGIVAEVDGIVYPQHGGVLGLSHQSYGFTREVITRHELLHALFYQYPLYRQRLLQLWNQQDSNQQQAWREVLRSRTYDPTEQYLVINELQAYLLAKPAAASVAELVRYATALSTAHPEYTALMDIFTDNDAEYLRAMQRQVAAILLETVGLTGGSLATVDWYK